MNTLTNSYDIIIIGSGIAGLYSAYTIQRLAPNKTFLVLEKYKKNWIGGRISNEEFYGTTVVTGAGIGRKDKDYLLQELLQELHIKYTDFKLDVNYVLPSGEEPVDVNKVFLALKKQYLKELKEEKAEKAEKAEKVKNEKKGKTFKQFAKPFLGAKLYNQFIVSTGYTDYENEDITQTLYKYGMDDNSDGLNGLSIPWKQLIQTLVHKIGPQFIRASNNVTSIKPNLGEKYILETEKGVTYYCDKVILATTITGIQKLLPQILNKSQFSIYNVKNRDFFERLLEETLQIPVNTLQITALLDFYWPIGTHYYSPLPKGTKVNEFINQLQHPVPDILVVGEVVAANQGWTEGALESVAKALTKKWIS